VGRSAVVCRRLAVGARGKASLVFGFRQRVVGQPIANRRFHVATLCFSVATFGFPVSTFGFRVAVPRALLALFAHE
jgi:hypothetical protein